MSRSAASAVANAVLVRLRQHASLSQQEVGERLNELAGTHGKLGVAVTANTVSRWERGIITPAPFHRRLLAELYGVAVEELGFVSGVQPIEPRAAGYLAESDATADPRVQRSQDEWRRARRALNQQRPALTRLVADVYHPAFRLPGTDLLAHADWLPAQPVDLAAIELHDRAGAADPELDGTERETANVRPHSNLVRRYQRYTHAIRDLEQPRLFENRVSWRLVDLGWNGARGHMGFGQTTYFAGVDVYETLAHEVAYVHLAEDGTINAVRPAMRDLPFRRLIGDPFTFARRPILPSIDTLTVRQDSDGASFVLHHRDPRRVAVAGGMLSIIPCGVFQPSSVLPAAMAADFDLWRNVMREYSEEMFGNPEHDGDGQPVRYDNAPFRSLEQARQDGRIRVSCLGVVLDALTLVGEILTVAVFDGDTFDAMAADFVEANDEGTIVNTRVPFTEEAIDTVLASGRLAPGAVGCLRLAWQHRDHLLSR